MSEQLDKLKYFGSSTIGAVLDQLRIPGLVNPPIRAMAPGTVMVGPAYTVKTITAELGTYTKEDYDIFSYIDAPVAGDVLVIDGGGVFCAFIGGVAATVLAKRGVAGVLIDGGYRDHDEIAEAGIPFFARHAVPISGKSRVKTLSRGETIKIGGVSVRAGDIVIADNTGVVVAPHDRIDEILAIATELDDLDQRLMAAARKGHPLRECSRIARAKLDP